MNNANDAERRTSMLDSGGNAEAFVHRSTTAERLGGIAPGESLHLAQTGRQTDEATPISGQGIIQADGSVVDGNAVDGWYVGQSEDGAMRVFDPTTTPLDAIRPIMPLNTEPSGETTIFVNGINNRPDQAATAGQSLANESGDQVYTLYNSAHYGDTLIANREAAPVVALTNTIYHRAVNGQELRLASTSEGSQVTDVALQAAEDRLLDHFGFQGGFAIPGTPKARGNEMARIATEQALSNIKVMTYGANNESWPVDGPKYLHFVDSADPGAQLSVPGLNRGGKGAVIRTFDTGFLEVRAHDFEGNYLPEIGRFSFDEMYDPYTTGGRVNREPL